MIPHRHLPKLRSLASRGPRVPNYSISHPTPTHLVHRDHAFFARVLSTSSSSSPLKTRGRKVRTKVKLSDLPQGLIPPLPHSLGGGKVEDGGNHDPDDNDGDAATPEYPTVVQQARRNMQRFAGCVLLTRVGSFYELYFSQADELGPLLNLKVASKKTNAGPVPMAGFPFFQLDRYLKILVQDLNRYVAVAEEFPNNAPDQIKSGGLRNDRRVARIITPGTLIDENFIDPYTNNYVMAICPLGGGSGGDDDEGDGPQDAMGKAAEELGETGGKEQAGEPEERGGAESPQPPEALGLAWVDVSTGHFFTQATHLPSLSAVLSSVCPREVVLDQAFRARHPSHALFSVLAEDRRQLTTTHAGPSPAAAPDDPDHLRDPQPRTVDDWTPMLESEVPEPTRGSLTPAEVAAGNLLLGYVRDRLRGLNMRLQPPQRRGDMNIMAIDKNSMRSLEIKQTIRDAAFKGSLLHAIRRTVTKGGARLLAEWLCAPSTSLPVIEARQSLVASFLENESARETIASLLRRIHDSQRLVQKFALGRGDPDELLALAQTIRATKEIVSRLDLLQIESAVSSEALSAVIQRVNLADALVLAERISEAIDEEGLIQQHEMQADEATRFMELAETAIADGGGGGGGGNGSGNGNGDAPADVSALPKKARKNFRPTSIRDAYCYSENDAWIVRPNSSPAIEALHAELRSYHADKARLAETLRERFGAKSLTLKTTPNLGHICHVKGRDMKISSFDEIKSISSSRSTRSFHVPEWTMLGQRLDQVRLRIRAEELRVLQDLREQVVSHLVRIRRNAAVLDELDIAVSFAHLALEQNLTRPVLNRSASHKIIGGRHATVEGSLHEQGRSFVRNDCLVGAANHGRLWLITGPNMAGKSTFLRQNALITILAQAGCYVPADHAEIGIVDAVFSRVGSADNLYRDQSTFMVEMLETAQILRAATPRSFVIMDEIGRGTTPEDGTAVAFASLHHLVTVNRCRTLFATHFHAVAGLAARTGLVHTTESGGDVEMYCTDVEEDGRGGFAYVHKLRRGINLQSHALKVARLAGLPAAAMETARRVLDGMGASRI